MRRFLPLAAAFVCLAASPGFAAQTAESKACSADATAKGLKGAARESFRAQCLKSSAPAAVKTPAGAKVAAAPMAAKPAPAPMAAPLAKPTVAAKATAPVVAAKATTPAVVAKTTTATAAPVARTAVAKTIVAKAPAASKPAPGTPRVQTAGQLAANDRMRQCGQQWQTAKAAGRIPVGQTWPQYWSACNTRMKRT